MTRLSFPCVGVKTKSFCFGAFHARTTGSGDTHAVLPGQFED